jgi:hypothetical protein
VPQRWQLSEHSRRLTAARSRDARAGWENVMNQLIYIIGLIVVVMAILTFLGLR